VVVRILSSSGAALATSTPTGPGVTSLSVTAKLPSQGTYYISLTRTGSGDPYRTGYSAYGSAGEPRQRRLPPAPPPAARQRG
jgi:hypothetical protein